MSDYEKRINPKVSEHFAVLHPENRHDLMMQPPPAPPAGVKYDQTKEPVSLLSRVWLLGVARVMGFGAKKYAAHNWRGGIERSRLLSAALRHILAYNEGEDTDPESGLPHLDHASCCLMFARETHETHPELDDRWKK